MFHQKKMNKKYRWIVIGGTFDHLHLGHRYLIKKAFSLGEKVDIGLTKDFFIKKKPFSSALENFSQRKKNLLSYLQKNQWQKRARIIPLVDSFGPSVKEKKYEAIIVSPMTVMVAHLINEIRQKKGLFPLKIIRVDFLKAEDGEMISSERIRKGEINREGKNYELKALRSWSNKKRPLVVTETLKEKLRYPLGKVFYGKENEVDKIGANLVDYIKKYQPGLTVTVGDIVSYSLLKNQFVPSMMIIDHRCQRKDLPKEIKKLLDNKIHFKIVNQPSTLSIQAFDKVKFAVENLLTKNQSQRVFVDGEEDLLVLPSIIFLPLKSLVFYGHWQYGVVAITVEEKIKKWVVDFLSQVK